MAQKHFNNEKKEKEEKEKKKKKNEKILHYMPVPVIKCFINR